MTDNMDEARKLAIALGRDYPDVVANIAIALAAAEKRGREAEREACAKIVREITDQYERTSTTQNAKNSFIIIGGHIANSIRSQK